MGDIEYQEALKLGKKEYKACVSQGRFPYLLRFWMIFYPEKISRRNRIWG